LGGAKRESTARRRRVAFGHEPVLRDLELHATGAFVRLQTLAFHEVRYEQRAKRHVAAEDQRDASERLLLWHRLDLVKQRLDEPAKAFLAPREALFLGAAGLDVLAALAPEPTLRCLVPVSRAPVPGRRTTKCHAVARRRLVAGLQNPMLKGV